MKARITALALIIFMAIGMTACGINNNKASEKGAPDYSKAEWWYRIPDITKEVDTFFIYPTKYSASNEGDPDYATLDNEEMRNGVKEVDTLYASGLYGDSTNLFMPYYRQAGMRYLGEVWKKEGTARSALAATPYEDVCKALDHYFENYNNGRPFILAGHSQGSAMCLLALEDYFSRHTDYYERMVAAYAIGYSVTKDELNKYPHMKFATGETDTGVIISWNTEGPKNVEENAKNIVLLPNAVCINPLNWKTDDTYAPASENLGSRIYNNDTGEISIGNLNVDAQINLERGVIVTNTDYAPIGLTDLFGPASFHNSENTFYFTNVRENVKKRIAAYFEKK